jgi:ATP-dependent helicase/nuclease subunit A
MSIPADRVWKDAPSPASVLTQGIIDVFWLEEDGIVLLDYKTDRAEQEELVRRYAVQLRLYAEALGRRFPALPVKEALIYSFRLRKLIPVK